MAYADLHHMLGGLSPAQFAHLPQDARQAVFRRHLVQDTPVIIDEGDDDDELNPDTRSGALLRQQHFMGDDETGKQLVKEAREIYYGENHFNVHLRWLSEFMFDSLGDYKTKVPIAPLLRSGITVVADLHDASNDRHIYKQADKGDKNDVQDETSIYYRHGTSEPARWTQKRLQNLFLFDNVQQVTLILYGRGLLDGSDLATHQTLKDISFVARRLMDHFEDRFTVEKMLSRGSNPSRSLRSYWDAPTDRIRRRVRAGEATFQEIMQIEMEEWTRVFPRTIRSWMEREVLV